MIKLKIQFLWRSKIYIGVQNAIPQKDYKENNV